MYLLCSIYRRRKEIKTRDCTRYEVVESVKDLVSEAGSSEPFPLTLFDIFSYECLKEKTDVTDLNDPAAKFDIPCDELSSSFMMTDRTFRSLDLEIQFSPNAFRVNNQC